MVVGTVVFLHCARLQRTLDMTDSPPAPRTGGRLLVDALRVHGVDTAFCVPGESYLAVLDALHDVRDELRLIVCRQEGGAAYMAEAHGKLTGTPGICFVTRGPGATNASIGVHTAMQDATPMILFIGQVGSDFIEREAFQEVDYRRMFGPLAKWVASIDRADRLPEMVSHAFHVAMSGRRGPVVLALPEDMLTSTAAVTDTARYRAIETHPGAADLEAIRDLLARAERPIVIAGGSGWNQRAVADLQVFAERFDLPVGCAFRHQDLFDNRHANYAGDVGIGINPKLAGRIQSADLVLALGTRLDEMTTSGYSLLDAPCPKQALVHVHAGPDDLGRVYQGALLMQASAGPMAAALAAMAPMPVRWSDWTRAAKLDQLAWSARRENPGPVQMHEVIEVLGRTLPPDAIVTNGAGNYATWAHRFYPYPRYRTQLAPVSGAMGYGVPAAIAAKLACPARSVVSLAGDGCFLMNGQELATAVQYDAAVVFIVVNNGMYGTIRMHQEKHYPERVHGTQLKNPDFAAYARSFGLVAETVERTDAFGPALERCLAAGGPALIEIRIDQQAISPSTTLQRLREQAQARQSNGASGASRQGPSTHVTI
jgi:acetolactate synthase-1/2/3 large subunit